MEFDELLITTGVDALVRLVKEKQKVELEEAASILNIPKENIEEWARVLEEESILRLEYRLTRIYMLWVRPTEEEAASEKESFFEAKKGVEGEVEQVKQRVVQETTDLEGLRKSFSDFYSKVYGRMESLEKMVSTLPASKTISEDVLSKYEGELSAMEGQLAQTRTALSQMRSEIAGLGIGRAGPASDLMDRLGKMSNELIAMQQEMASLRKKASAEEAPGETQMPSFKDIKKKFEAMQKDLLTLRSRNAQMRQDMLSLHESSEILKSVAESIMGQDDKIGSLRSEVASLSQDADRLAEKTASISSKVRQNVELIERLGDSVDVAKNVLKKFPNEAKVLSDLEKLKAEEDDMAQKTEALGKLIDAVGGKQVSAKQISELSQRMDEKAEMMRKDMDALESALADEKSTYLTFQKIKERIVPSLESYMTQLDSMEQKIARIRQESASQISGMKQEAQKLQESLKSGPTQDVMKVVQEIRDKKKTLDEIRSSLEELGDASDSLNKRVTLLSQQAKLLDLRIGSAGGAPGYGSGGTGAGGAGEAGGGGGAAVEEKGVRENLALTKDEEMEFRRKREELKKLIQTLWGT